MIVLFLHEDIRAASSKNVPSSMPKCADSDSSHACAKSHPGICSLLIHSIVTNDLGLRFPHMPGHVLAWHVQTDSFVSTRRHIL